MKKLTRWMLAATVLSAASQIAPAQGRDLECSLEFTATKWSVAHAGVVGKGVVTCRDGSSMPVSVRARGGGVAAGKWNIADGKGKFAHVVKIEDVLGDYRAISGDFGVSKAGTTQALTKGKMSLLLTGKGKGFGIGIAMSDFIIGRPEAADEPPAAER